MLGRVGEGLEIRPSDYKGWWILEFTLDLVSRYTSSQRTVTNAKSEKTVFLPGRGDKIERWSPWFKYIIMLQCLMVKNIGGESVNEQDFKEKNRCLKKRCQGSNVANVLFRSSVNAS